jgi:hypothetical protein
MSSSAKEVDQLVRVILAHYKLELVRGARVHGHGPGDETIVRTSAGGPRMTRGRVRVVGAGIGVGPAGR